MAESQQNKTICHNIMRKVGMCIFTGSAHIRSQGRGGGGTLPIWWDTFIIRMKRYGFSPIFVPIKGMGFSPFLSLLRGKVSPFLSPLRGKVFIIFVPIKWKGFSIFAPIKGKCFQHFCPHLGYGFSHFFPL